MNIDSYQVQPGSTSFVKTTPEEKKNNVTDSGSQSASGLHRFFTGVRNSVSTMTTKIGDSQLGRLFTAINKWLCEVSNRIYSSQSTQNINVTEPQNQTTQTSPAQSSSGDAVTVFKEVLFQKFSDPEKMANHFISTAFNDGGDNPDARKVIKHLKSNLLDSLFSTNNIEYTEDGITLMATPRSLNNSEEPLFIEFDKRKLKETPYLFEFMKNNKFDHLLDLAGKIINHDDTTKLLYDAEKDKFLKNTGQLPPTYDEVRTSSMKDIKLTSAPKSAENPKHSDVSTSFPQGQVPGKLKDDPLRAEFMRTLGKQFA